MKAALLAAAIAFGLVILIGGCGSRHAEAAIQCAALGYPESKTLGNAGNWRYFCVRRVNGTDEVREILNVKEYKWTSN